MLALDAGYTRRMMLEISPEHTTAVVALAFKGCEGFFGLHLNGLWEVRHLCQLIWLR